MLSRVADSIYWMSRYVERAENVDKDFMNYGETENHAERVANPVEVEQGGITAVVCGKNHGKTNQLHQNVTEKELELAMQPATEHEDRDSRLKDGMCDPERVIKKSNLLAHHRLGLANGHSAAREDKNAQPPDPVRMRMKLVRLTLACPNRAFNAPW